MPRRKRASKRRNIGRRGGESAALDKADEVYHGSFYILSATIVSGSAQTQLQLNANNFGTRLSTVADLYRLYRFVSMDAHFGRNSGNDHWVAFSSGQITAPTTIAEVSEMPHVAWISSTLTMPGCLRLRRKQLCGISPWYETQSSAGDPLLDTQGTFTLSTSSATTGLATATQIGVLYRFTVEFRDRLPAATTVQRLIGTDRSQTHKRVLQSLYELQVDDCSESRSEATVQRARTSSTPDPAGDDEAYVFAGRSGLPEHKA